MSAPFIFIGTHTVNPGQLEAFQKYFSDFCDTVVEPNEPRLLSFQAYADAESNQVTVVQIHPDAESMVHHMTVITQDVDVAYADYLERGSRWQIYGTPRAGVLEKIQALGGGDSTTPKSHEPFAGFTRWLHPLVTLGASKRGSTVGVVGAGKCPSNLATVRPCGRGQNSVH